MSYVEVLRGTLVESRHAVHVVVADGDGVVVASTGDVDRPTYYRSAAKPFQALPLVEEGVVDRFGLTTAELALCCASHEGEPAHVAGARSILAKAGADETLLRCGPHAPFASGAARELARAGAEPERIHNNCSGKHAGMIVLALALGWDPVDYHRLAHPVQQRMLDEVARWSGLSRDAIPTGVDGCGVACFAVPLGVMAASFARFAVASASGEPARRVVDAMTGEPFMVGGTGRTCTEVMEVCEGDVFVKLGAEGVYGGGVPARGLGFAIKVEDGGRRAVEAALMRTLSEIGALSGEQRQALARHGHPEVRNTRDEIVGEVRASFALDHAVARR